MLDLVTPWRNWCNNHDHYIVITPVTPALHQCVTPNAMILKAVTRVTPVTPEFNKKSFKMTVTGAKPFYNHLFGKGKTANCCHGPSGRFCLEGRRLLAAYQKLYGVESDPMSLVVEQKTSFEPPPEGTHLARCYRIIDLGTQPLEFQGAVKLAHRIMIGWELTDTLMADGKPYVVSKRFTASLHKKASLTGFLAGWRGRQFTDEELAGFDLKKIIGAPCLLTIGHEERDGNRFANILACTALPKGMTAPPLLNKPEILELEPGAFDQSVFDGLPEKLQEAIRQSPQYKSLFTPPPPAPPPGVQPGLAGAVDPHEEIPF